MATLLFIDTAGEKALVGVSQNNELLAMEENNTPNAHANFVQVAIENVLKKAGVPIQALDAIVVTMGPGSYTGLRVGLASAKGIAYVLNKPLIGLSTLALLAKTAIETKICAAQDEQLQIFSMIDARRMEVFGAVYNKALQLVQPEQAIVLDTLYMEQLLLNGPLVCIGSGVAKTKTLLEHPNLFFLDETYSLQTCIELATTKFNAKEFEDLAYSSPAYIKDFYQKPTTKD
ncbi:MAG: tRNA ((37)-N6)-threonylcarbamoyltransferase complex dimerization subunit type 1 TsaB, partial [Bacteroidota bacterium]